MARAGRQLAHRERWLTAEVLREHAITRARAGAAYRPRASAATNAGP